MPIDHVTATVSDFETGKSFYTAALKPLGYDLQMEFGGSAAGFGPLDKMPDFWIGGDAGRGASHIAFTAPDRATGRAFYEAAMAAGGKDNGAPATALPRELLRGLRPRRGRQQHRGRLPPARVGTPRLRVPAVARRHYRQREIRDLVRTLARERIGAARAEIDESHEFPWDIVELYREHGLFGLFFDEEYGGLGTGTLLALSAIEEVSKVCATSGLILAVQELGSLGLKLAGNDEQKERYLKLASGERLCAYAPTESGQLRLGCDANNGKTRRRRLRPGHRSVHHERRRREPLHRVRGRFRPAGRPRRHLRVRGRGGHASASRSRGSNRRWASAARLPASSKPRARPFQRPTCSDRKATVSRSPCGSSTARVRDRRRSALRRGRPTTRSEYAKTRETMGKPIGSTGLIAAKLADMETACEAARGLLYVRPAGRRRRPTAPS